MRPGAVSLSATGTPHRGARDGVQARRVRPEPLACDHRRLSRCLVRSGARFENGALAEREQLDAARAPRPSYSTGSNPSCATVTYRCKACSSMSADMAVAARLANVQASQTNTSASRETSARSSVHSGSQRLAAELDPKRRRWGSTSAGSRPAVAWLPDSSPHSPPAASCRRHTPARTPGTVRHCQIEIEEWKCLVELIVNSFDAFNETLIPSCWKQPRDNVDSHCAPTSPPHPSSIPPPFPWPHAPCWHCCFQSDCSTVL